MQAYYYGGMFNPESGSPLPQGNAEVRMHMDGINDEAVDAAIFDLETFTRFSAPGLVENFTVRRAKLLDQRAAGGDNDGGFEGDYGTDHAPKNIAPSSGCLGAMVEVEWLEPSESQEKRNLQHPRILSLV